MFNLFDKMVLPIAMYGSEVWGTNYIPVNSNNNDFFGQPNLSKHDTEILHYRYMKLLLGVPRKTANWAVNTETGRYPTIMRAMKAMIKYYFHLGESKSPFVISALAANKNMAGMGINTWFKNITRVFTFCGLDYLLDCENKREISKKLMEIDHILLDKFKSKWTEERGSFAEDSKLNVLVSLKSTHEISEYLLCRINPLHKLAISKIRLSAHKLPIETERYTQVPRVDRICPLGCQLIGDEYHYLLKCIHPAIHEVYAPIVSEIKTLIPGSDNFETNEVFKGLLNSGELSIIKLTGKLCHQVLETFKEITW